MVLELKLRKIGNSVGLVLPKEALTHLKAAEGDVVCETEAADRSLRLSPTTVGIRKQMQKAQNIMKRYRNALRELAK